MAPKLLLVLAICRLIIIVGLTLNPTDLNLNTDQHHLESASTDFGKLTRSEPIAVLNPTSTADIAKLVKLAYESPRGFAVSARGHGHSINGQSQTANGVVVQMSGPGTTTPVAPLVSEKLMYVDVWVVSFGLTCFEPPLVWARTQIVDRLFIPFGWWDAVERRDQWSGVRWIRVLYSNFSAFTHDQEYLISLHDQPQSQKFDYIEGFVIVDEGLINNWRSSFFSPNNPVKITSLGAGGNVLYCLEITKNYHQRANVEAIDQEVEALLSKLNYIPASMFTTDLPYVDFLDRVHTAELKLRSKGLWEVPHPWLNLFVPKSRIDDFDKGVFKGILGNKTSGPILIYPMNKNKWDEKSSVVTPNEDVFYLVALLRSALDNGEETLTLKHLSDENSKILNFCKESKIEVKQYLPHYTTQKEWMEHYGDKWPQIYRRKMEFDPRYILATGQRIFNPSFGSDPRSSW
ncbi:hypothetical protein E3N88_25700 [Mikania micrantha]|uniref:cytokinin dehydrogenase n=1 Tax=Mikania micrantha TaxID=192012 RepID=A0A5N6N6E8_9ASTR|nr:hypothetical protein E3N88_25700 [Mikania micrantha]